MPKIKQPSPIKITRKFPPANTIEEREPADILDL